MKKLVVLENQASKEAWDAYVAHEADSLGLKPCNSCGEYVGKSKLDGEVVTVRCICDGIKCNSCKLP